MFPGESKMSKLLGPHHVASDINYEEYFQAVNAGDLIFVKSFVAIENVDVCVQDIYGDTALQIAQRHGHTKIEEILEQQVVCAIRFETVPEISYLLHQVNYSCFYMNS